MSFQDSLEESLTFTINLNGETFLPRLKLGNFFLLDKYQNAMRKGFTEGNIDQVLDNINKIFGLYNLSTQNKPLDVIYSLITILNNNRIRAKVVFLDPPPKLANENPEKMELPRWVYDGRVFSEWIHLFASHYGWELDKILNLPVDTAMYLLQEIMVTKHQEKEWQYSLTEMAYEHDKNSGKSKYRPLDKPYWMDKRVDAKIEKVKIPKRFMPQGLVIDEQGNPVNS